MDGLNKSLVIFGNTGVVNGGSFPPQPCTNFVAKTKKNTVQLTWTDPENSVADLNVPVFWDNSVVVRKQGSVPADVNDGVIVVTNNIRNQYQTKPFVDTGLSYGVTYYYRVFSCSRYGVYNDNTIVSVSAAPKQYRVMTVQINLNDSNPFTCGGYADDAVYMREGKSSQDWAEFFGYRPCLFKSGAVVGYLKPNDYTKFVDGTSANITSGSAGDVMVEFPRRGLRISKKNKILTVSMTDEPDNPDFKYYAHQRGDTDKDYFYVGAYLGYVSSNKLRSLSGKTPTASVPLSSLRTYANNLGSGYMEVGFYQFVFLQCMYLLQYKGKRDSQTDHGYGYCAADVAPTGSTNTKGMMYGTSNSSDHVKLFGIEDFWGNLYWFLDGYYVNNTYHVLTATDNFNDTGHNYTDRGIVGANANITGYFNRVSATTETGFTPTSFNGSSSTYFCDYCEFKADKIPFVGGRWGNPTDYGLGIFRFGLVTDAGATSKYRGGRLGYL